MDTPDYDGLQFRVDDRGVARLTFDRPDKLNALTNQTLEDIADAIDHCRALDDAADGTAVRAVVIDGAGDRAFSAGYDVTQFAEKTYPVEERAWRGATRALERYDVPVVAKIDGYCLGGGLELALACDFRLASERSTFGFPEIDIGLFPSGGGTQRLVPLVGPDRTLELCMTGEHVGAEEAAADGLVTDVVPQADLDDRVEDLVGTVCSKPPLAIRALKDVVTTTRNMAPEQGLRYELEAYQPLLNTEDHREGVAAFEDDREPTWQGR
ncbi:enoyl-CoA hydratase/isomerase family protein [Halobacteriales archaeon Cl-PHB]